MTLAQRSEESVEVISFPTECGANRMRSKHGKHLLRIRNERKAFREITRTGGKKKE
ncbi:MAG: hypothetical protein WBA93_27365 [Microcoleaceae cyanobacterium]